MPLKRPKGDALVREIAERAGYVFRDAGLLRQSMTHSSALRASENNERLEFLGDRVLSLIIADLVFRRFPDAREGQLAPRFNALVEARTLTDVGKQIGLDALIHASASVKERNAGHTANYIADATEALIGAVYLEGGLEAARDLVLRFWEARLDDVIEKPRNAKSDVQEWLACNGHERPVYGIVDRSGPDHEPVFTVELLVPQFAPVTGQGRSRQAAEQAAATAFMLREGAWEEAHDD